MATKTYVRTGRIFDPGPDHSVWYGQVSDIPLGEQFDADIGSDAEAWLLQEGVITTAPRGSSSGGSGGLVLGAQNDRAFASFSAIPCDGSPHNLTLAGIGSPPAWLDVDGNITEAGLYTFVIGVSRNVAPTTSGLAVYFSTPCNGSKYAALDILRGGDETLTETEPVTDADLPFFAGTSVVTPTDDTATFDAFYVIVRAAH